MASSLATQRCTAFAGAQQRARASRSRVNTQTVAAVKKVNSYDDEWQKGERGRVAGWPLQRRWGGLGEAGGL